MRHALRLLAGARVVIFSRDSGRAATGAARLAVTLLISPKEVDQEAVKTVSGMEIVTLPGVGLKSGSQSRLSAGLSNHIVRPKNF